MNFLKNYSWVIIITMLSFIFIQNCSNRSKIKFLESKISRLDSLPSKKELNKLIKIEGLKSSKRTLYDNNFIWRTQIRPDDRMNLYDQDIKKEEESK